MKKMFLCIALCACLFAPAQISIPGPGWSRDSVVFWYKDCDDCDSFVEWQDNTTGMPAQITFVAGDDDIELVYSFDSTGMCCQYEEYWPLVSDTAVILKRMRTSAAITPLPGRYEWKETVYDKSTRPIEGRYIHWSLQTGYIGILLVGEVRYMP